MFIGITTNDVKQSIIDNFRKPSGQIRVLIYTSSFGKGIDCKGVERVLHWGTPSDIEMYIQEVGRAGRAGQQCCATLFVKPSESQGTVWRILSWYSVPSNGSGVNVWC